MAIAEKVLYGRMVNATLVVIAIGRNEREEAQQFSSPSIREYHRETHTDHSNISDPSVVLQSFHVLRYAPHHIVLHLMLWEIHTDTANACSSYKKILLK